ncbi:hypothetical protein B0T20DRAFT_343787, partial [Sordaria brevicollis]
LDDPLSGYGIEDITWAVQTSPGGPTVNVTGTIEDVHRYAEKVNPNYRSDFALHRSQTTNNKGSRSSNDEGHEKDKRYEVRNYDCDWGIVQPVSIVKVGIARLREAPGHPVMGPGPGNCGRVMCERESAIYWCNDSTHKKGLDTFGNIADGAQLVVDTCTKSFHHLRLVAGAVFLKDEWSVQVTFSEDCQKH